MDPEDLLRQVEAALERGRSVEEINVRLREATGGRYTSIGELRAVAIQAKGTAARDASAAPGKVAASERGTFAGMGRAGRLAGEVFAFGGLDEGAALLRGLVEGAGAALPGGRSPGEAFREAHRAELDASRERLLKAQEEAGPGTKAVGFGLGLLGPGLGVRAATAGTRASRLGTPALRGAAAGAAEGAAFGALSADPDPDARLGGKLAERGRAAALPGILGAVTGAAAGTALAGRRASRAKPTAGARLGEAARRESGLTGRPSRVTRNVASRKRTISREMFRPLEELGEIDDPAIRRVLRADDVKPIVKELFPDVAKGERAPTFLELQKVKKRLGGLRDRAVRSGDSYELDRYGRASEDVVDALEEAVEGFPEAQRAWAIESARLRALEEARRVFTKTADDVEEAFRNLPKDKAVRDAFREGLAAQFVARLEKLSEPKAVLRQIQNSPQLRDKLRVLFGGEEALERFTREALGEERLRNRAHFYERVRRWAGLATAAGAAGGAGSEIAGGILGR